MKVSSDVSVGRGEKKELQQKIQYKGLRMWHVADSEGANGVCLLWRWVKVCLGLPLIENLCREAAEGGDAEPVLELPLPGPRGWDAR